jgi:hypothetical protein
MAEARYSVVAKSSLNVAASPYEGLTKLELIKKALIRKSGLFYISKQEAN